LELMDVANKNEEHNNDSEKKYDLSCF